MREEFVSHVVRAAIVAASIAYGGVARAGLAPLDPALAAHLVTRAGFEQADLRDLRGGDVVVRSLETADTAEMAVIGVMRVDRSRDEIVTGLVELDPALRDADRRVVAFSEPPALADLDGLELAADVVKQLPDCKVGDCALKLPRVVMVKFRDAVDWRSARASDRANALFRSFFHETMIDYRTRGGSTLPHLDDKKEPVVLEDEFRRILARSSLKDLAPEVAASLEAFPRPVPPHCESILYWTRETVGPRQVTALRHRVVERNSPGEWVVSATRLVYANHFFRGELELAVVVPREDGGSYLLRVDRARLDPLTGVARLGRGKVHGSARKNMAAELESVRSALLSSPD